MELWQSVSESGPDYRANTSLNTLHERSSSQQQNGTVEAITRTSWEHLACLNSTETSFSIHSREASGLLSASPSPFPWSQGRDLEIQTSLPSAEIRIYWQGCYCTAYYNNATTI